MEESTGATELIVNGVLSHCPGRCVPCVKSLYILGKGTVWVGNGSLLSADYCGQESQSQSHPAGHRAESEESAHWPQGLFQGLSSSSESSFLFKCCYRRGNNKFSLQLKSFTAMIALLLLKTFPNFLLLG